MLRLRGGMFHLSPSRADFEEACEEKDIDVPVELVPIRILLESGDEIKIEVPQIISGDELSFICAAAEDVSDSESDSKSDGEEADDE